MKSMLLGALFAGAIGFGFILMQPALAALQTNTSLTKTTPTHQLNTKSVLGAIALPATIELKGISRANLLNSDPTNDVLYIIKYHLAKITYDAQKNVLLNLSSGAQNFIALQGNPIRALIYGSTNSFNHTLANYLSRKAEPIVGFVFADKSTGNLGNKFLNMRLGLLNGVTMSTGRVTYSIVPIEKKSVPLPNNSKLQNVTIIMDLGADKLDYLNNLLLNYTTAAISQNGARV